MTTSWLDELNARPVLDVALALAYRIESAQVGPCPACKAAQRGKSDKRPPVGINTAGNGWQCHACGVTGASTTFAAFHYLGAVPPKGSPLWGTLRDHVVSAGLITNTAAPTPAPVAPPKRPPQAEVLDVWARCQRVDTLDSGDAAAEFLALRRYGPPSQLAALDIVRVMPIGMPTPWWWPASWSKIWRLMMLAYEADGTPTALHARAVVDADAKTHWLLCERDKERVYEVRRLLFANPIGLKMLRGVVPDELVVVVGEGLTGTINTSLIMGDKCAVFGATSGGFKALADVKAWPKKCTVYVVTDDKDKLKPGEKIATGERYAREILDSVPSHCTVKRVRWNAAAGEDDPKRDSGDVTKEEYFAAIRAAVDMRAPTYGGQQGAQDSNRPNPPPADAAEALAQLTKIVQEVLIAQSEDDQRKILAGVIASALPEALRAAYLNAKAEIEGQFVMLLGAKRLKKEIDRLLVSIRGRKTTRRKGEASREKIEISNDMPTMVEHGLRALGTHEQVFQNSRQVVTIGNDKELGPVIHPASHRLIRLLLAETATFTKLVKRGEDLEEVEEMPPEWLAPTIGELPEFPFRQLTSIARSPLLRADGTIATERGYDAATRTFLDIPADLQVEVREDPTLTEVSLAVERLNDLFVDFPFEAPHHRSAALAAILTVLARPAIDGPCPMFLFSASSKGSGKSLLLDCVGMLTVGRTLPHQPYKDNDEEMAKTISSVLLRGAQAILFDNIDRPLGGAPIELLLTAREWADRRLQKNEMIELVVRTLVFGNGNNVQLKGDMARRVVPINLVPLVERPWLRTDFKHGDLLRYVRENRGELIAAALTVLRGYVHAGRPPGPTALGGYMDWCAVVRNALIWAGEPDPCLGMEQLGRDSDPRAAEDTALVHAWREAYGSDKMALSEIQSSFAKYHELSSEARESDIRKALYDVLRENPKFWDRDKRLLTNPLGYRLRKLKNQIRGGYKFVAEIDSDEKVALWSVTKGSDLPPGMDPGIRR